MGFYLGVNGFIHGFCKWVLPRVLSVSKKGSKWIQKLCDHRFYTGWNQVVLDPKKDSKWFKKLCATRFYMGVKQVLRRTLKAFVWVLCGT